jgi:uncharacterized protein YkwD
MKMRKHLVALVLFVGILASCTKGKDGFTNIGETENALEIEQELLLIVNDHRLSLNESALQFSEVAYEYANQHNDYMIAVGNISHDNFSSRASKISLQVSAEFVAENVARNYDNATGAFQGWLNSSSHKTTMEGDFTHTAVSVKKNNDGKLYFTQIFFRK